MSTIINTGTTITEPFDVKLQAQTIEIGSTAGPAAAVIFGGDSLTTAQGPSLDSASLLTSQVPGQTSAETTLLDTLGRFINAGTIAADAAAGSVFTIEVQQYATGSAGAGQFLDDGLITVAAGNTIAVAVGANAAFDIGTGGTLAVAAGAALDIGAPGSDAAAGAVNVAGGQLLTANGLIDASVVNDGTIATSDSGTLEIAGSVGGAGTLVIGGGGTLELDGPVSGQSIVFGTGAPETLVLGTPGSGFSQPIVNFQDLDTIAFGDGVSIDSVVLNATTLTIATSSGQYVISNFTLAPDAGSNFSVSADHSSITLPSRVFTWDPQGDSTAFGSAGNWSPGAAPGANDFANFTSAVASGTITGTGTAGELEFAGSTPWVLNGADIDYTLNVLVGEPGGTLTLTGGATLNGLSAEADQIGSAPGDSAAATVSGTGTSWQTLGTLAVGDEGSGALAVSNDGSVSAASGIVVGESLEGSGSITVESGANVTTSGSLLVGDGSGTSGDIELLAGGTLAVVGVPGTSAVELGVAAGASGSITVSGTAAAFSAGGSPVFIGVGGSGSLLIENQGTFSTAGGASAGGLAIGAASGGSGDVTVSGTGSAFDNAGPLIVGGSGIETGGTPQPGGLGALFIIAGGQISTSPAVGATGPAADIAADPGTDGSSATVTGTGSEWTIGGSLMVGDLAAGSLAITAGGSVGATALSLGNTASGVGELSVSGTASALSLSTQLLVGAGGIGDVAISNGATISAASGTIGLDAGASGVVDLEGAASRLSLSGDLDIGEAGTGVLIMGVGNTTLSVEGNLNIGSSGELAQFGGVIDPANVTNHGTAGGTGTLDVTDTLSNDGVYFAQSGSYEMNVGGLITGSGTLAVGDGGDLVVNAGSVSATEQVAFNNDTVAAVLSIGTLATFGAVVDNFNTLASIVLAGITVGSDAYTAGSDGADGVLTLYAGPAQSGGVLGTLSLSPEITAGSLAALEMVNDGTIGGVACFAAGTRIATASGEVAVEALRPGDRVRVLADEGWAPVVWLGQRQVVCRRHPRPSAVWPVRVAAGAFGPGRPRRDLWLSPDHALFLAGVLIPVKYLIDGAAIVQVACEAVTYYHVELPRHAVLLAEGLAAESYLDTGDRGNFANGGGVLALYPDFATLRRETAGCAPLVVTGAELEAAKAMLAGRRLAA